MPATPLNRVQCNILVKQKVKRFAQSKYGTASDSGSIWVWKDSKFMVGVVDQFLNLVSCCFNIVVELFQKIFTTNQPHAYRFSVEY